MNSENYNLVKLLPLISTLLIEGCMPRQADGTYPVTYSYHPYNQLPHRNCPPCDERKEAYRQSTYYTTSPQQRKTSFSPSPPKQNQNNPFLNLKPTSVTPAQSPKKRLFFDSYSNQPMYREESLRVPHRYNIEDLAKSFLDTPYKWGAIGPYEFDCSGFTQYIFAKNGINIPRVSYDQARVGLFIPKQSLQKGDLVFFSNKDYSKTNHTGIYLGNNKFIHASRSNQRVLISDINEGYFGRHFQWGRRVIP